ncbi:hypothetical protein ES332_D05G419700v1 [Gossypium tomentosum]|uniref:Uncharacterized protein n=1 Tax=Gossypium tomentosum TaxID=34277 RepID=A0A5D2L5T5_GOSTO|nr:hypothetical protein ES332_D05G419700v1 [Gossypium tomentosum]
MVPFKSLLVNSLLFTGLISVPKVLHYSILDNNFVQFCRKNVVSLSNGVSANVVFVWEEVCGSYHTHNSILEHS